MDSQIDLVREELRLRLEITAHELYCLAEDGADPDAIDAKLWEHETLMARRDALERQLKALQVQP